ncbi:hypothetical protein EVAR_88267_1 [Eumeta japonica]|uniref:Uncharacterized protein n=1 Tax=Eumeta variegata TaxID=151549 RepID=A0A4C1XQ36_EUMVA|nr:hypothetical protein EVAR_88267_1 [Eumeta japonica]
MLRVNNDCATTSFPSAAPSPWIRDVFLYLLRRSILLSIPISTPVRLARCCFDFDSLRSRFNFNPAPILDPGPGSGVCSPDDADSAGGGGSHGGDRRPAGDDGARVGF